MEDIRLANAHPQVGTADIRAVDVGSVERGSIGLVRRPASEGIARLFKPAGDKGLRLVAVEGHNVPGHFAWIVSAITVERYVLGLRPDCVERKCRVGATRQIGDDVSGMELGTAGDVGGPPPEIDARLGETAPWNGIGLVVVDGFAFHRAFPAVCVEPYRVLDWSPDGVEVDKVRIAGIYRILIARKILDCAAGSRRPSGKHIPGSR